MIRDLRFALRQLLKAPGFTIAAVTVLALGIGVNTAVFSLVNTLFFAPPAYGKPHEMVQLFSQDKKDPKKFRGFSYPTYLDIREQNTVFSDAMSFNLALIGLGQKGDTRRAFGAIVSSNYFSVLGVPLARGRAFLPEEETPGRNAPVAIVSYSYWLKHDLDPSVLGSQVLINGRPFTIVGITPKGFAGTLQILSPEVWLPMSVYDQVANDFGAKNKTTIDDRNGTQLRIIGRLKPGMTAAAAKPPREGFVLALLGGVGGLILGLWSSDLLIGSMRKFMPVEIVWSPGANPAILAATFGFCLLGTLMFALGPALKISRSAVITDLKEHAGEDAMRRRWKFLPRNPLVVVQLAFSLALLTAAALFVRGANKAASVDSGLKPGASYLLEVDASLAGYEPKRAQELYQNLNARLAALPGVEHVSISATVPFGITSSDKNVQRAGINPGAEARPSTAAEGLAFKAAWNSVGANYFSTVGLPVLRGRAFTEAEATQPGPSVAIIDEPLAKKLWPDGDALGQRVQYARENTPSGQRGGDAAGGTGAALSKEEKQDETIEIVGIVPVTRHDLFASEEPDGSIYLPFARGFQSDVSFFVRFRSLAPGTEAATADSLRRAVRDVDPSLPIISLQTFAQFLDSNLDLWLVCAGAAMFSVFGGLALGLAVVGLYGVKAYPVARRTREIGIRMALGAQPGMVLRLIMREGSVMLLSGLALGLVLAVATAKIVSGLLYGVGALDPVAFTVAPAVLTVAALIATWLPARRATRVNPAQALHAE